MMKEKTKQDKGGENQTNAQTTERPIRTKGGDRQDKEDRQVEDR